ncbi:MAG: hypothetical protein C5B51_27335 [Terriglobia bacterium]|nr:MAG: hypothetical protein C5B51_27335 [Terriglobia bacterium]
MKIAFVVHDYRRMEGHSRYVVELATRFAKHHEVHVFANQFEGDTRGIQCHFVPAWRPNALTSIVSFAFQATLRVRGDFDIIHNQGLCGLRGNVITAHICNRAWSRALRRVQGSLSVHEWISGSTLSILEYLSYRAAAGSQVIAVSNRIARDLKMLYGCRSNISVIHHGVDLEAFRPACDHPQRSFVRAKCGLASDETVFLFVGDLRKGARQCLEALAHLPAGKLLFVSRTPDGPYRALASQLELGARAVFLGATTEVEQYYAAADAFLLPTHYDSFAMVVTEAMASALPVIVSREAGVSELIQDGANGLVLDDFSDATELASKMRLLLDNPHLARRLGVAARNTTEDYSWDMVAARTMRVYQQAVAGARLGTNAPYSSVAH